MAGAVTFLLPMLLRSRSAFPRARVPKRWWRTAVTLLFLPLARPKPRNKKPWRRGQPGFGPTRGEAMPLVRRETLCVDAIRFRCIPSSHVPGGSTDDGLFQGRTERAPRTTQTSRVWTAPCWQGKSLIIFDGRCAHVFGLFVRRERRWPSCSPRIRSRSKTRVQRRSGINGFA